MTGGIGWFLFETDSQHFADIIGAPANSYGGVGSGDASEPLDGTNLEIFETDTPGIYNDKSWFQPMCPGKCIDDPAQTCNGRHRNPGPMDPDFKALLGCSQNKKWDTCSDLASEACKDMYGIVPAQWNMDRGRVYVEQNRTHLCLSGMNLASDPLASWKDCLVYDFAEVPTSLLSFTFYGNIAFLVILVLSFAVEYYFHKNFMHGKQGLYIDIDNEKKTRGAHHLTNVLYHVVVGVFAIMLGAATMDLQRRYSDEMEPQTIQKVTTENRITFDPYDDENKCFTSDVGMLVWNTALGTHKAHKGGILDTNNCTEYTIIYFVSLLTFGLVYILSGVLIGCTRADKGSWEAGRGYVHHPKPVRQLSETERLQRKIRELEDELGHRAAESNFYDTEPEPSRTYDMRIGRRTNAKSFLVF